MNMKALFDVAPDSDFTKRSIPIITRTYESSGAADLLIGV